MAERLRAATAVAVLLALTACPAPAPDPDPSDPSVAPPAGGAVTLAYPSEPATLDPFSRAGASVATRDLLALVMPGLYRRGPSSPTPWLLAREPEPTEEAPREVTLDLRPDAVWSDGRPITVRDLIFTWRHARSRDGVWSRDPYDRIASVEQVTPTRARVTFTQPFVRWREIFGEVLPAHAMRTAKQRRRLSKSWPVSGGPFILKRWRPGLDMLFERNPRAWNERPELDSLRVVFVPDGAGALELLQRGRVQVLGPYLAPDWDRRARMAADVDVSEDRGGTMVSLVMNTSAGVTRSAAVRKALALVIDQERVVETLIQQEGAAIGSLLGDRGKSFAFGRSLSRANAALDADGWRGEPIRRKGGRELAATLAFAADDDIAGYLVRALQRQASYARFRLESVALERRDLDRDWLDTNRFQTALIVTRGTSPRGLFGWTGTRNLTRLRDRALDARLDELDRGQDHGRVAERFRRLVPLLPLYDADVILVSRDVEQVLASASMPFWNAHEWKRAG